MSAVHTAGLLTVSAPTDSLHAVRDEKGRVVADVGYSGTTEGDTANGRRLVACWNFCEGLPTDALQAAHLQPQALLDLNLDIERLTWERSTLIAALQAMVDAYEHEASPVNPALLQARRALACTRNPGAEIAIPPEAASIGAVLDGESLEQGEPG